MITRGVGTGPCGRDCRLPLRAPVALRNLPILPRADVRLACSVIGFLAGEEVAAVDRSIETEAHQRLCEGLKRLRARRGVTQRVLAERLGVRQTFVSAYERGDRRLDVVELRAIAVALGGPALAVVAQLDALDAVLAAVGDNVS